MSIQVIPIEKQASGQFNSGQILENKPLGFPQDGGTLRPYSNLFYWAHAWTPGARSMIGEHPHQGFEIMSFVLKGSIEHYDSKLKGWRKLEEGDAQIIRAGKGITHAELVNEVSEFFQIWLDPDLSKTLGQEASYDDYKSGSFPMVEEQKGIMAKVYKGEGGPMVMDAPGIIIKMLTFSPGAYDYVLKKEDVYSAYLLAGIIKVDDQTLGVKDYIILNNQAQVKIESNGQSKLFIIQSPAKLDYLTYAERVKKQNWN